MKDTEFEVPPKKTVYDGIRLSERGANVIVISLSLIFILLIAIAIIQGSL